MSTPTPASMNALPADLPERLTQRDASVESSTLPSHDLIERLHWEADNKGLPPFSGWGWLHEAAGRLKHLERVAIAADALRDRVNYGWHETPDDLAIAAAYDAIRYG